MIGLDTSFLIDLYWQDSPRNKNARALFSKIVNDDSVQLAIYFNCFNEFLNVITEAIDVIDFWCDLDRVKILYPDDTSFKRTLAWMNMYKLGRNRVNDTQMASCYLSNNITSIITANPKDFEIFHSFELQDYRKKK